ncbi:uncharacterized protein LOC117777946 [Hippoglossus hippoglossus]|uniref:uncharacterized protein LOC117777946 n=1 Tax=Hippoglossus hippoglossus TaxID=8267 RepID=UPI00148B3E18|nr:uncharacterized protein LOC117777946 [Hippoglossus hippoglossus]
MAGEDGWRCRSLQTVAVLLLLCTLAPSLTCFSLWGLSRNDQQDKVVSEASAVEIRTGSILFNGKELNSESGSPSAAATNDDGLPHVVTDQPEGSGMFAETLQLNEVMANEGAWKRLNPALRCGQTKMKFKAMGPGAADLQLNIGNEHPLPLTQLPESCGHSLQQSTLGLVLVAPYDGCNVIQENGNYVVSMTWLEAEVKLTCPILQSPDATPAQHPWKRPVPHRPSSFYHPKRHVTRQTGKWREATMGVREGTIVFGRGAESHVANGNRKAPSNASAVEDERAYQADSAGLLNGQAQDTSPKEASWKRMAPSLQCGGDQMKFRAVGPGASQFAVDQGNAHPMPLSQVPSTCGYTMQRNSLALVMLVPYDGCNMVQEGGSYMLPMLWQGIPVSLWCNKPPATTSAQPQDPVPMVQFPGYPPFYPWYLPGPLPTPAETTTTTQKMTTKPTTTQSQFPQLPKFPPYGPQVPKFPPYGPQLLPFPPYGPQIPYGPYPPYPFPQFIPPFAPKYPTSKPETTTVTPEPTRQTTATKGKTDSSGAISIKC